MTSASVFLGPAGTVTLILLGLNVFIASGLISQLLLPCLLGVYPGPLSELVALVLP